MANHIPARHLQPDRYIVWAEVHGMSMDKKKVNLGHGSPEEGIHEGVMKALALISSDPEKYAHLQQYTLLTGHPRLLTALSKFYSPLFGRELEPGKEILVTCGASFAIYCTILGLVNPGDEVIIIEPFYEQYPFVVEQARGIPVYVPLRLKSDGSGAVKGSDWQLDPEELESKFSSKTKIIIVNNPHNPMGKVFTRKELEMIGNLAKKYNAVILMDEVYEFLIYEGSQHVRMATLPGMWERTITISSAGKIFHITGWRIGWIIAPPHLLKCALVISQDSTRTAQTNLQEAIAIGLESEGPLLNKSNNYWKMISQSLQDKRDRLIQFMSSVGMEPNIPQGTYFTVANISVLASKVELTEPGDTTDFKFFRWLSKQKGLICVPMSSFYSEQNKHLGENYVRFCFTKKDSTLARAETILKDIQKTYF